MEKYRERLGGPRLVGLLLLVSASAANQPKRVGDWLGPLLEQVGGAGEQGQFVGHARELLFQSSIAAGVPRALNGLSAFRAGLPRPLAKMLAVNAPAGRQATGDRAVRDDWDQGVALFDRVYGPSAAVTKAMLRRADPSLAEHVLTNGYGHIMSAPVAGLSPADRELGLLAALVVMDVEKQVASHSQGAINCGATQTQVDATIELANELKKA